MNTQETHESPDTDDIAQVITRFLAAVSFEIGQTPDYTVLPDLFTAGAQLIRNSGERPEIATVPEFVEARVAHLSSGLVWFREDERGHHTETFGRVGHRFSTYRKQGADSSGAFDVKGCISTQVVLTPAGWRISAMAWDDERPGLSVPSDQAPTKHHSHRPNPRPTRETNPMSTMTTPQTLLAGQHATPPGPVDLTTMYVMHHAFRRDLDRFQTAVTTAEIDDRARWLALHQRWELFSTVLHYHHAAEDAGLWPLLLERANAAGDHDAVGVLDAMAVEHALIDPALEASTEAFAALAESADEQRRSELRRSLEDGWRLLDGHMGHEEREAMALVQCYLTEADWQRVEREHFRPAYSLRETLAVVPWAMSGLPHHVRRQVLADAGRAMGLLWRATRGSFARAEERAFGAHASGLVDRQAPVAVVVANGHDRRPGPRRTPQSARRGPGDRA